MQANSREAVVRLSLRVRAMREGRDAVTLQTAPVARPQMLIRKPVAEVFEAFVDPAVTSKFWFTKGSERLATGKSVR